MAGLLALILSARAVKKALSFVPTADAPPMIATEISAAIRPYSIAVAPDSS